MKLIEFMQGNSLNAEIYTRNEKRISFFQSYQTPTGKFYLGQVDNEPHVWRENGEHMHTIQLDLMVKVDSEPEYTYQLRLKDFLSSKYASMEDLKHYLSAELIKQGTIIKNQR